MNRQRPMCRAIEPDLLSIAAGQTDSAAAGRVEAHVGGCQLCRDELAHSAHCRGVIDSLRRAPLADEHSMARARLVAHSRICAHACRVVESRGTLTAYAASLGHQQFPLDLERWTMLNGPSRTGASGRLRSASQQH
jgi:hypothetical protein